MGEVGGVGRGAWGNMVQSADCVEWNKNER